MESAVELRDGGELSLLSAGGRIRLFGEGVYQWEMVGVDPKGLSFEEVLEVSGGQVDGEELPVEGRVSLFGVGQFLAVEGEWCCPSVALLLEDCTDCNVAGVGCEVQFGVGGRKREQCGVGEGVLGVAEGGVGVRVPSESLQFALEKFVEWCQSGSDVWKEAVVKGNQAQELL